MPFKNFAAGAVLTEDDLDTMLMRQTVMTFASASARDTALSGVLDEGMTVYLEDTNSYYFYTGSAWLPVLTSWQSFTPVWSNLTVTGATNVGQFRYVRGSVEVKVGLTAGVGTVIGSAGIPSFTLPDALAASADGIRNLGTAWYSDSSAGGNTTMGTCQVNAGSTGCFLYTQDVTALSDTVPFTWANGDKIDVNISVRVA